MVEKKEYGKSVLPNGTIKKAMKKRMIIN